MVDVSDPFLFSFFDHDLGYKSQNHITKKKFPSSTTDSDRTHDSGVESVKFKYFRLGWDGKGFEILMNDLTHKILV